jgi:hypothetical protein
MCIASQYLSLFVNEQSPCIYHCPLSEQYRCIDPVVTLGAQCETSRSMDILDAVAMYNPLSDSIVQAVLDDSYIRSEFAVTTMGPSVPVVTIVHTVFKTVTRSCPYPLPGSVSPTPSAHPRVPESPLLPTVAKNRDSTNYIMLAVLVVSGIFGAGSCIWCVRKRWLHKFRIWEYVAVPAGLIMKMVHVFAVVFAMFKGVWNRRG